MSIKTIGKDRGNIFIWLALFVFSLIMPCAVQAVDAPLKVEVQPQNASPWRGATDGTVIIAVVTGATDGDVWGGGNNTPYTDDSSIASAAVHAGALAVDKTGFVKIIIRPGRTGYIGSNTNHGVTSKSFSTYFAGSYEIDTAYTSSFDSSTTLADPGNFAGWGSFNDWKSNPGWLNVSLTGVSSGSIWGTDTYTGDSLLARAAMHAGKLRAAGTDVVVKVKLSDGLPSYDGSTRYGVTSNSFGSYGASFKFDTTECAATIDKSSSLFIPSCTYEVPLFDSISLWIELVYEFSANSASQRFKLVDFGINDPAPATACVKSVLSNTSGSAIQIKLTGVTLPNATIEDFTLTSKPVGVDGILYFGFSPDT
jgi:hypothetical protein